MAKPIKLPVTLEVDLTPEVTRIEAAEIKPGDILVVTCHGDIDYQEADDIRSRMYALFPGHKVLVLTGATLDVKRPKESTTP